MFNFLHSAFVTAIFVYLVPFAAYSQPQQGTQPAPRSEEAGASDPATEAFKEITALYYAGKDDAVVKKVDVFFRKHQLTKDNLQFLFFQAASYYRLGKIDKVIRAYDRSTRHRKIEQRIAAALCVRLFQTGPASSATTAI